jgi:D-cysteine desulfhydrase
MGTTPAAATWGSRSLPELHSFLEQHWFLEFRFLEPRCPTTVTVRRCAYHRGVRPDRLDLALKPTPLHHAEHLSAAWGGPRIWVKRDDLTGFELSGNKVRKLEYHLAAARADGATTVVTAGAEQSNHCRATALAAASLGLDCVLLIRTSDGSAPEKVRANHALHHLAGARIVYVDPAGYRQRDGHMDKIASEIAARGGLARVIPEGASDALGMLGMADAFEEMHTQADEAGINPSVVWHASSSAGTTAGFIWGSARCGSRAPLVAVSVGDSAALLEAHVESILADAIDAYGPMGAPPGVEYRDDFVAGGYGVVAPEQADIVASATRCTGMLFDPTYTGKALYALNLEIASGRFGPDDDVVFWHTGGGFAALA